jgi:hypothetical protein
VGNTSNNDKGDENIPTIIIIIYIIFIVLTILHLFYPSFKLDTIGLVLIFGAMLPWIIPYLGESPIKSISVSGNEIKLIKGEISKQQKKINKQQEMINNLIVFSMSSGIFEILSHIYHRREYKYPADEGASRNLRFLRDSGYLHYFQMSQLRRDDDLSTKLKLTTTGELLVQERERREQA